MLGTQIYNKSINSIKTLSDGKTLIQNGKITNVDSITTKNQITENMTILNSNGDAILISNDEFQTLNGIDTSVTIQQQLDDITGVHDDIYTQIATNSNNISNINTEITTIDGQITTIQNNIYNSTRLYNIIQDFTRLLHSFYTTYFLQQMYNKLTTLLQPSTQLFKL
jgi:hypothetical protein